MKNNGSEAVSGLVFYPIISTEREKKMAFQNSNPQPQSQSGPVGSFPEVCEAVREQIEVEAFRENMTKLGEEVTRIIAEIYMMQGDWKIRIDGQYMPVKMVQQVYNQLEHDHVAEVLFRFAQLPYEIRHVKTYLRTALYNAVFETEARVTNEVARDHAV